MSSPKRCSSASPPKRRLTVDASPFHHHSLSPRPHSAQPFTTKQPFARTSKLPHHRRSAKVPKPTGTPPRWTRPCLAHGVRHDAERGRTAFLWQRDGARSCPSALSRPLPPAPTPSLLSKLGSLCLPSPPRAHRLSRLLSYHFTRHPHPAQHAFAADGISLLTERFLMESPNSSFVCLSVSAGHTSGRAGGRE